MSELIPFSLHLSGGSANRHEFQGYDGYMALAGFAWTLALVTNYVETGSLRQRGAFPGRDAVTAKPIANGSIIADFSVLLTQNPGEILTFGLGGDIATAFLIDIVCRVIARNIGMESKLASPLLENLVENRGGDIEALVARTEPAVRQSHAVIGRGAHRIKVLSGRNIIADFNSNTQAYVNANIEERNIMQKDVSVSSFNANSGHGSVFDHDLGRVVPVGMSRDCLRRIGSIMAWGLGEYANKTDQLISITFTRILAQDGTPKRYQISNAAYVD